MDCKDKLEAYLRENQVPYEVQHHPMAFTAQRVAASEHISGQMVAKVVMVVADGKPVMLALPAAERVHVPHVAHVLEAKEVHLAQERDFAGIFPDCELGAMPPFGNLYGVPVYIDTLLAAEDTIFFQAGNHTDTISMKYADFARLVRPAVAAFSLEEAMYDGR
jgi:Ala-tRNA(Pro) deacylase